MDEFFRHFQIPLPDAKPTPRQGQGSGFIVTSDGKPDICSTGDLASGEQFDALIQKTLDANPGRQVKLHTVWVGSVVDEQAIEFMKRLAAAHGGTFRKVNE